MEVQQALDFQEILVQVTDCLSKNEVLELVFLCSDMLRKDLSNVVSARELFSQLQNHDLLHSDDSSLLVELLKIIKRDKLIRELGLNPQLLRSRVSRYRKMLYALSENISDEELKNFKFMLHKSLPRKKLEGDVTLLHLFLEMEKGACLGADNLGTIERIIGTVCPHLKKIISCYQTEEDLVNPEGLLPPSYFIQPQSTETRSLQTSFSGDAVQAHVACLNITKTQHLTQGDKNPSYPEPNQNKPVVEQYHMSGDWRGYALIINNHDFSRCSGLKNRDGTDIDEQSLVSVLKWLGFKILLKQDCSKERMLTAMTDLCTQDHTPADCVVCCVLTHGYEGGLYGVDGEGILMKKLLEQLDGLHCPSLKQKPKLFFIQACQGHKEQEPAFLQSDGFKDTLDKETGFFCDAEVPREAIPVGADYLVAMATVPGFVSFREKVRGTWFIQSLCEKLKQLVPSGIDLLSILTEVNKDVSRKADKSGTRKQMPQPEFTLTKRVVFPIPKTPPPS
ncbi:hypothetical protein QTP70_027134 [Hemibagrus guttatus]|uniref:Caspase-8 n=1 Tax=Hemibagrus guttatus TaxID=175788 RepID=A0AAE0R691_9TELE|nr:hypothetical protein QTP70_027134 [Hemibagrus guttatus]